MNTTRPSKPRFSVFINDGFTTPVEPSLCEFDDDDVLLDLDWCEDVSYATFSRDQIMGRQSCDDPYAPLA